MGLLLLGEHVCWYSLTSTSFSSYYYVHNWLDSCTDFNLLITLCSGIENLIIILLEKKYINFYLIDDDLRNLYTIPIFGILWIMS